MDNSQKIVFALQKKYPESAFVVYETYESLKWETDKYEKPTKAEFDLAVKEFTDDYTSKQYQRDRQYPTIGDQLDLLYHDMTSGKGDKTGEWYKAVKKVKDDNPKPE